MSMIEHQLEQLEHEQVQWEVSIYDIAQTPVYKTWALQNIRGMKTETIDALISDPTNIHVAFVRPPVDTMNKALYSLGMDTSYGIDKQICPHKTFGGTVVQGERYVGKQRSDKEWKRMINGLVG